MSASVYSFAYDQGSHHAFTVQFQDAEGAPDTAAVEGFSGRGQVRRTLNGEVVNAQARNIRTMRIYAEAAT